MSRKTAGVLLVLSAAAFVVAARLAAATSAAEIDKFNNVSDKVATGGQPTIAQIADLKREGFKTILCLREPSEFDAAAEEAAAKERGLTYINIPVNRENPRPAQVDAFLAALSNPRVYPVFIHCATANRVAAFWMIRRVLVDKWDLEDAQREAKLVGLKNPQTRDFALDYLRTHGVAR
jgi:uncharacterized protein (TIGR01244 family)